MRRRRTGRAAQIASLDVFEVHADGLSGQRTSVSSRKAALRFACDYALDDCRIRVEAHSTGRVDVWRARHGVRVDFVVCVESGSQTRAITPKEAA